MARILVVDDEAGIRDFLRHALTLKGHEVVTVPDSRQAISVTAKESLDLIILDVNMPGEGGVELLKKLRAGHNQTPIIVYSGFIDPETEKDLRRAGANEILSKEVNVRTVQDQVEKVLGASSRIFGPKTDEKQKTLLIVDDDASIRGVLTRFFKGKKFTTLEASGGEEAVRLAVVHKPALVLLDFDMPGMNGLETLEKIMKIDPAIGVVMVTGLEDSEAAQKAMQLGAYGYVLKPFDFVYLELVVMSKLLIAGG